eukprot:CAMPEP_0168404978 /NCGR_PEP_ID=MMETSP0228-20121227/24911_1 /TAXON_ID=133427 /ORGANISM="Protoceratium reticulatum, Strain CCCM 535 (=CCMP 1889)" /LENGTH=132 /DNA_ID=CAMNT_0008418605 /DNA_START=96 /DNA_END=492 /DNA_ORIENTATION=+
MRLSQKQEAETGASPLACITGRAGCSTLLHQSSRHWREWTGMNGGGAGITGGGIAVHDEACSLGCSCNFYAKTADPATAGWGQHAAAMAQACNRLRAALLQHCILCLRAMPAFGHLKCPATAVWCGSRRQVC